MVPRAATCRGARKTVQESLKHRSLTGTFGYRFLCFRGFPKKLLKAFDTRVLTMAYKEGGPRSLYLRHN